MIEVENINHVYEKVSILNVWFHGMYHVFSSIERGGNVVYQRVYWGCQRVNPAGYFQQFCFASAGIIYLQSFKYEMTMSF
jgi:hypothetical protein